MASTCLSYQQGPHSRPASLLQHETESIKAKGVNLSLLHHERARSLRPTIWKQHKSLFATDQAHDKLLQIIQKISNQTVPAFQPHLQEGVTFPLLSTVAGRNSASLRRHVGEQRGRRIRGLVQRSHGSLMDTKRAISSSLLLSVPR